MSCSYGKGYTTPVYETVTISSHENSAYGYDSSGSRSGSSDPVGGGGCE